MAIAVADIYSTTSSSAVTRAVFRIWNGFLVPGGERIDRAAFMHVPELRQTQTFTNSKCLSSLHVYGGDFDGCGVSRNPHESNDAGIDPFKAGQEGNPAS